MKKPNGPSIGLCLSGGGARGLAHVGVLTALNELSIFPSQISGSSAGSIIGALYCAGYTPAEIFKQTNKQSFLKIFKIRKINKGISDLSALKDFLTKLMPESTFEKLKIPFHVSVTNIDTGMPEIFNTGNVIQAVMASSAIPILFEAVAVNNNYYVDGGLTNNLPIEPLQPLCDKIIGVGICPHDYDTKVSGITDIGMRCFQIAIWNTMELRMKSCDLAIDVSGIDRYGIFDFDKSQELFDLGYEAVMKQSNELTNLILEPA